MKDRRIGKFKIDRDVLESEPWIAYAVMGECIIIRAEFLYDWDAFSYTAISKRFKELKYNEAVPEYDIIEILPHELRETYLNWGKE